MPPQETNSVKSCIPNYQRYN